MIYMGYRICIYIYTMSGEVSPDIPLISFANELTNSQIIAYSQRTNFLNKIDKTGRYQARENL